MICLCKSQICDVMINDKKRQQREKKIPYYKCLYIHYANFSANFICNFDMDNYPFDVQVCLINITLLEKQLQTTM